jgi:hypothetical protein
MTLYVGSATSELVPEPEPAAGAPAQPVADEEERFRALAERLARDAARTRAEAYDD